MSFKKIIKNKTIKISFKISITLFCFYILYSKIDFSVIGTILLKANYFYILLAVLFFIFSKYISTLRLNLFFEIIRLPISEKLNFKLYLLGMYYNLFLPGGIGGDGYKAYYLRKKFRDSSLKEILKAILFDRLSGLSVLFDLSIFLLYFLPFYFVFKDIVLVIIIVFIPISFYFLSYLFFKESLKHFFRLFIYSFGVQLTQLASVFFIIISLNIHDKIYELLFVFLLSTITVMIPITIGGSILRELTFVYFSTYFLYDKNHSITIALLFYLINALVSLLGMYYSFHSEKLKD